MSNLHAFNCGANILAFKKNDKKYGMCCAWAMMADYDKLLMLIGAQSETGKMLEIGDIVGVSGLKEGQDNVALNLGMAHSSERDKFANVKYYEEGSAILVSNAKTEMVCEVLEFVHTDNLDQEDKLVLLKVLKTTEHKGGFLYGYFMG